MRNIPPPDADKMGSRLRSRKRRSPPADTHPSVDARRWLYGTHVVAAALANPERRWRRLSVLAGREEEARALVGAASATRRGRGEAMQVLDHHALSAMLPAGAVHQGIALEVEPLPEHDIEDVLRSTVRAAGRSTVLALDRVSDPQNIGAIMRSGAAFGALAVLVPAHGTPAATGALAKAASGALEIVPLVRVVNLARALDRLKAEGFWICGLDASAPSLLGQLEFADRVALVLGGEGGGMRRLVRERCDFIARLPTRPQQPTLNVASAAAVALYELVRASLPPST